MFTNMPLTLNWTRCAKTIKTVVSAWMSIHWNKAKASMLMFRTHDLNFIGHWNCEWRILNSKEFWDLYSSHTIHRVMKERGLWWTRCVASMKPIHANRILETWWVYSSLLSAILEVLVVLGVNFWINKYTDLPLSNITVLFLTNFIIIIYKYFIYASLMTLMSSHYVI